MKIAIAESLLKGQSYLKYRNAVSSLLLEGRSTGPNQSGQLTHYSALNEARMNRLDKKLTVPEENIQRLLALDGKYIWLAISEGWCGDAAQILPVINKLASISSNIEFKIVLRDDNEQLMSRFLTNGTKSIPKLIVLDAESKNVLGNWGPRPKGAADLIKSYKQQYGHLDETAKTELQLWYLHDKGLTTQKEIIDLMANLDQMNVQTI